MLSPLSPREQPASTKKIPNDTGLPSSGTLGPAFRAGPVVYLLSSLTATGVRPQTAGTNVTYPVSLTALSKAVCVLLPPPTPGIKGTIPLSPLVSLRARACFHLPPEKAWRLEGCQCKNQRRKAGAAKVPTDTLGWHSEPTMEPPPEPLFPQ